NININARTLFATHYHELTELNTVHKGIFNLNVAVNRDSATGKMIFMHNIEEGSASKSYGIDVAELAGLPSQVVERAKEILFELEKSDNEEIKRVSRNIGKPQKAPAPVQLTLFSTQNEALELLKAADLNNMTPLEALNLLHKLKGIANG
ncbi:MAG: DNA mismatch repair protein MutS, partial [Candidatus Riflebacteria bacterium]|nr:DNA mismatch repair protein MutS [Candidatus Riflebacteria bacterium]